MLSAIWQVVSAGVSLLGLGFVMGFSPALYAIVIHLLSARPNAERSVRWVVFGAAFGATLIGALMLVINPDAITTFIRSTADRLVVSTVLDATVGLIFLAVGVREWRRRNLPRQPKPPKPPRTSPGALFALGVTNAVLSTTGLATMYLTGRVITGASTLAVVRVGLYAVFLVPLAAPYLALAWAWQRFPGKAAKLQDLFESVSSFDWRPVLAIGLMLAGVMFGALGAWELIRGH